MFTNSGSLCLANLRDGSGSKIVGFGGTCDEHPAESSQGGCSSRMATSTAPPATVNNGADFEREGYTLVGWTINGKNYKLGETVDESFATVQNATVQAYAIWQLNENGNTTVTQPDEEIEDEDVPLASAPANPSETPKTGDDSGVFKSMIVGAMALVAMAVLVLNKKKYVLG